MSIRSISTFAAGALLASALTFTGMQSWQAGAAPGDNDTTFVPVAPCRLFDTRPGPDNVGTRSAALGPADTFTTQVTGTNGNCIGIPNDATAVAMNVTVARGTAESYLTLFPADLTTPPRASNLNWVANQPAVPNKVDVKLSPDGKVKIYNNAGAVDVIADIVGYYTPSSLSDLESRLTALETDLTAHETNKAFAKSASVDGSRSFIRTESMVSVVIDAPAAGTVLAFASGTAEETKAGEDVACMINTSVATTGNNADWIWEASGATTGNIDGEGDAGVISGTKQFDVAAGSSTTFHFVCRPTTFGEQTGMRGPTISAMFLPD